MPTKLNTVMAGLPMVKGDIKKVIKAKVTDAKKGALMQNV